MTANDLAPLVTIEVAAQQLGTTVTHTRRLVADQKLRCVWVGRFIRFTGEDLAAFVEQNSSTVDASL